MASILPLQKYSDQSAFDPTRIQLMSDAFEEAWQSILSAGVRFSDDDDTTRVREIMARAIC